MDSNPQPCDCKSCSLITGPQSLKTTLLSFLNQRPRTSRSSDTLGFQFHLPPLRLHRSSRSPQPLRDLLSTEEWTTFFSIFHQSKPTREFCRRKSASIHGIFFQDSEHFRESQCNKEQSKYQLFHHKWVTVIIIIMSKSYMYIAHVFTKQGAQGMFKLSER